MGRRLGVIPSRRAIGTVLVQCKVEEVYVLGTVIVVHCDGSCTCGIATVVVQGIVGSSRSCKLVGSTMTVVEPHRLVVSGRSGTW